MQKKIDLINGPILSSLTKLALPIMATSLIQMAYNMIDMIWIGRLGSSAVASVGAAGMYMWLSNGPVSYTHLRLSKRFFDVEFSSRCHVKECLFFCLKFFLLFLEWLCKFRRF